MASTTLSLTKRVSDGGMPPYPVRRFTVDEYHQMIDADILTEDDPVELLEGWLVTKMPKKPQHSAVTLSTRKRLEGLLPAGWFVDSQEPVTLDDSEPEPDIRVAEGDISDYLDRHPGPLDIALLGEVADSSLARDQSRYIGSSIFARAKLRFSRTRPAPVENPPTAAPRNTAWMTRSPS